MQTSRAHEIVVLDAPIRAPIGTVRIKFENSVVTLRVYKGVSADKLRVSAYARLTLAWAKRDDLCA